MENYFNSVLTSEILELLRSFEISDYDISTLSVSDLIDYYISYLSN